MKKFLFRYETIAVTAIAFFCAVFLVQTFDYGRRAGLFPRLISVTVLSLILVFVVSRLRRAWKARSATAPEAARGKCEAAEEMKQGIKWPLTFGLAVGFFVLLYLIGFGPAAVCYLIAHIYAAGFRKGKVIIAYALAVGVIMVSLGVFFKIPLPKGVLVEMILPHLPSLS